MLQRRDRDIGRNGDGVEGVYAVWAGHVGVEAWRSYRGLMEYVMRDVPTALEIVGIGLLWTLKGVWFAFAFAVLIAWAMTKIILAVLLLGRLPRSYVRVFD